MRESPNGDFDIWTIPLDWVVVILNYRRSQEYVRDLVELLLTLTSFRLKDVLPTPRARKTLLVVLCLISLEISAVAVTPYYSAGTSKTCVQCWIRMATKD